MNLKGIVPPSLSFDGSKLYRHLPTLLGLGVVLLLATFLVLAPSRVPPAPALGIALFLILLLPGYLATKILLPDNLFPSLTDIPIAFVFSLAIWSIPAALVRLLRQDWLWFDFIFVITLWALGVLYGIRVWQSPKTPPPVRSVSRVALQAAVVGLALGAGWIAAGAVRSPDDWSYLVAIRLYQTQAAYGLDNFQNARDALRFAIQTPLFLEAFALRLSQYDPVSLVRDILPTLCAPLGILALYAWAREFSGKAWVGLLAIVFQLVLFLLVGAQSATWGTWFFGRIAQDKFMAWLLLMPIALLFFWRYLQDGRKANLFGYGMALIAIVMVHPVGLATLCLGIGGFAFLNLIQPTRFPTRRWLLTAGWIVPVGLVGLAFRLLTPNHYFLLTETSDPAVASYLSLSDLRLVLLPPTFYFAHPALIMHPVILLAIGLVPLLAGRLRQDVRVQFLWGSMLVPLALLYSPAGAWVLGQLVMPWELWRLMWVLPVALTLAYLTMLLLEFRVATQLAHGRFLVVWVVVAVAAALYIGPLDLARTLTFWARTPDISAQGEDVLRSLPRYVTRPSLVLVPIEWQQRLPAYALTAQPATAITMARAGEDDADVETFYASTLYTAKTVHLIAAPGISFIVLPTASYLNEQLLVQDQFFAPLYKNGEYALYQVLRQPKRTLESVGLQRLKEGNLRAARKKLQRAVNEADNNALAWFGLGAVYAAIHLPAEAETAMQQALQLAPNLRIAHLKLGELYEQQGRADEAAREFGLAK